MKKTKNSSQHIEQPPLWTEEVPVFTQAKIEKTPVKKSKKKLEKSSEKEPGQVKPQNDTGSGPGRTTRTMASLTQLLAAYRPVETSKHVTREFQLFGLHLAKQLEDPSHTSLYIRLAKSLPRTILEQALSFVSDANARDKAKLFMWKLSQLRQAKAAKSQSAVA